MHDEFEWQDEAKQLFGELLSEFPAEDRERLREEAARAAERVARETNVTVISIDHILPGLILATPLFLRDGIRKALEARGYDMSAYQKYFSMPDSESEEAFQNQKGNGLHHQFRVERKNHDTPDLPGPS